jgi:hypothetical protein
MVNDYDTRASKYAPHDNIRILFVAEAPPCSTERYFYFENVPRGDWLWIALMKALYPLEWTVAKSERPHKSKWLEKFAASGFLLIDAVKTPISGSPNNRIRAIAENASGLIPEILALRPEKIVLIKTTVHDALFDQLRSVGLPVVNEIALPFPSSGQQKRFHDVFSSLNL